MVKIYVGMCSKIVQFSTNISTKFIMIKFLVRFFFSFEQKINNIVEVFSKFLSNVNLVLRRMK